jgi:hypothetical protein
MPYEAHTTILSLRPNPCEIKIRAYFSANRCQSSQVRKKLFGVPLVPLVSWIVKISPGAALLNWNSSAAGGWFSQMVWPEIIGRQRRSSCRRMSSGLIPCSLNQCR